MAYERRVWTPAGLKASVCFSEIMQGGNDSKLRYRPVCPNGSSRQPF
jgi:hypothetical protein